MHHRHIGNNSNDGLSYNASKYSATKLSKKQKQKKISRKYTKDCVPGARF